MKGFDPLVATIVLVVIAVGVAAMLANWQNWFLPVYSEQVGGSALTQLQCARAGMSLDNLTYNCLHDCRLGVDHTLSAAIRNNGDISLQVKKLYLESTAGNIFEFNINKTLVPDTNLDFTNTSGLMPCTGINRSIVRVSILTNCPDLPSIFDGSIITWINC